MFSQCKCHFVMYLQTVQTMFRMHVLIKVYASVRLRNVTLSPTVEMGRMNLLVTAVSNQRAE